MSSIQVLPEKVANQIAAGEVIERPASIVKELVENALDAGARSVEVEVEHGGRSLIRVSDDGCGMDPEDARLAFQRHATSKIAALEDLEQIASFGFRGEALPSIAAVSRCRLVTRANDAAVGTEVVIEGGSFKGIQDHPCRKGTVVEVRDLFFNTPARRKFLKSESTELGQILEVFSRMAFSALGVRFLLKGDGKVLLDLIPCDRLLTRAAGILGDETASELLELQEERAGLRLWGVIGKPSLTRGNRSQIQWFINRRWIRSLPLSYAVQAGYHGMLMEGRYPVAILFLGLEGRRLDVNVHPAKQEVRISNESEVTQFVQQAVRACLSQSGRLVPSLKVSASAPAAQRSYLLHGEPAGTLSQTGERAWSAVFDRPSVQEAPATAPATPPEPIVIKGTLRITRILGQVHGTFLLVETEEGLGVVDQHAAHERVVFEKLLQGFRSGETERQMLFLEETLELPHRQREIFQQSLPLLNRLGFEIEPFGEGTHLIRATPSALGEMNAVELLQAFLDQVEEGRIRTTLDDAQEAVAALCACKKGSVKAGDRMEPQTIRMLLERLGACDHPFNCPHGRPIFFTLTVNQLEKQFKRI